MNDKITIMDGVTEYCENDTVEFTVTGGLYEGGVPEELNEGYGRLVVKAFNEGGFNTTEVDLVQLLEWVKTNLPDVWNSI